MILRTIVWCFILSIVRADDAFDCHPTVNSFKFDLDSLKGEHTVSRTRDSPPSTMVDLLRFDLCAELNKQSNVSDADQCPPGTRACLTKTNKKLDTPDRIIAVIPLAQTSSLDPKMAIIPSDGTSPKGLSLLFHGSSFPDSRTALAAPQSLNVTLLCSTERSDPKFLSYNGSQLYMEWSVPAACGFKGDQPPNSDSGDSPTGDQPRKSMGSGIGWFFLVVLLGFALYFGLGAYYNYTTYGATGADLIPHRDFWREVPYMLQDVVAHLCSLVRTRRPSSRGYIAV